MKKSKNILILFLIMAILVSLYLFLKNRPEKDGDSQTVSDTIFIVDLESDKINKIVLKSKNHTLSFVKKDEQWTANLPFPIKEGEVNSLSYIFFKFRADQLIDEAPVDLEQYGLKDPAVTIEVSTEDQRLYTMYLGQRAPTGTSYYFKLKDDPAVYTIPDYNAKKFMLSPADFRDNSLAQIEIQDINYFKLSRAGKPDLEIRLNIEQSEFAQYGFGIWQMTKPYQEPMSVATDKFQPILQSITSITNAERFVDDNPVDLSRYGLAKPQADLLIKTKKSQFRLLIGNSVNGEDAYYCKKSDSKEVFTLSGNSLSFLNTKPFELIEKFVYIVNIDNVDKVTISGLGSNRVLEIVRKEAPSKDEATKIEADYLLDGKKIKEDQFKKIYQSLISLLVEAECPNQPKNATPELKMTFHLNKGPHKEIKIDYIPYDYDFYAVFRGGKAEFLISKDQVKAMIKELENLIKSAK